MAKIQINNEVRDMTAEEQAELEASQATVQADIATREAADAQKASDKASAKAKLIAGEALTEAEADTIVI